MDKKRLLKSDVVRLGILMGLCLALGIYLIATTVLISKDGVFYIGQAQGFARDPLSVARRHPAGYPAMLWLAHAAAGLFFRSDSVLSWIHVSQGVTLLCRVLALIPLYLLGKSLIGEGRAFWAVLILILLPYPAQFGSDVLRDWPYVLSLSLGFWLLYEALRRRVWWMFALVGLDAAVGYLIQPAAAQLVLYGLLGLVVALRRDPRFCVSTEWRGPLMAALVLIAGFAVPALPFAFATGTLVPPQLKRSTFNSPPVITSVGGKGASRDPLEFEVREGELLEITVEASDPQGDNLKFSLASVPAESRPVYQLRLIGGDCFMTISEDERDSLLEVQPPAVRDYVGIVSYAYARADAQPDLEPVHRLWSPALQRHFYTIDSSEKDAVFTQSPRDRWTYEGIAFYAFGQGRRPPDAVPVHRFRSEQTGYSWNIGTVPSSAADEGFAWYVHVAGEPPAGMSIQEGTLRWRPGPGQHGQYGINIVVSDGDMESCQLVKVTVREGQTQAIRTGGSGKRSTQLACLPLMPRVAPPNSFDGAHSIEPDHSRPHGQTSLPVPPGIVPFQLASWVLDPRGPSREAFLGARVENPPYASTLPSIDSQSAIRDSQSEHAGLGILPGAADRLFDGFTESLMVFFLVPWCVGLYHRMRYKAGRLERVLMTAVIVVNVGLILCRYAWVAPTMERRYCLPLVALTIFYVPVGLERIALWLSRRTITGEKSEGFADKHNSAWFHVLALIGIGICVPKLLTPLYAEKDSYVKAIQWLRDNTGPEDVTAVPDNRLTFYARRPGLLYRDQADPRRADYIVRFLDTDAKAPAGWSQAYSVPIHDRRGRTLVIYKTHRRKG